MKHSLLLCLLLYGICPLYSVAVKQIIAQTLYIASSGVSQSSWRVAVEQNRRTVESCL